MKSSENMGNLRRFVRISDIQAFYLIFTLLFLSTGFLYNLIFFSFFKVRVDLFFNLQDYLSTSIEKVYLVFVTVGIAVASSFVIKYLIREKNELLRHKILLVLIYVMPLLVLTGGLYLLLVVENPIGYFMVSFSVYVGIDYLFYIFFKRYHDGYKRYFYLTAIILYILVLWSTALYERENIIHMPLVKIKQYYVHFKKSIHINQDEFILLEANSNYYFFYDKGSNRNFIVPKDDISFIEKLKQ